MHQTAAALDEVADDDLIDYVRLDKASLTLFMKEIKAPIRPAVKAKVADFTNVYTKGRRYEEPADKDESVFKIILSILLEAIGFRSITRAKIAGFLLGKREISQLVDELALAVKNRRWHRATRLLQFLINELTSPKILRGLGKVIGEKAMRKLLLTISARCLPFIGQGLLIAALTTAFIRNWDRLEKAWNKG